MQEGQCRFADWLGICYCVSAKEQGIEIIKAHCFMPICGQKTCIII